MNMRNRLTYLPPIRFGEPDPTRAGRTKWPESNDTNLSLGQTAVEEADATAAAADTEHIDPVQDTSAQPEQ